MKASGANQRKKSSCESIENGIGEKWRNGVWHQLIESNAK
jgi:hypothetical protein